MEGPKQEPDDMVGPDTTKLKAALDAVINDPGTRLFAVVEGALFEGYGLSRKLAQAGLVGRPLHLGEHAASGPWLIDLHRRRLTDEDLYIFTETEARPRPPAEIDDGADAKAQLGALLDLIAFCPRAAVFWCGEASLTQDTLYRHLRGLNQALVPAEAGGKTTLQLVTFRHADANVMAQVLPALSEKQVLRIMGPANSLIFQNDKEWGETPLRVRRLKQAAEPTHGPLRLEPEHMQKIAGARRTHLIRRIADYLREAAPAETQGIADEALRDEVLGYVEDARRLGVTHDVTFAKWAYLRVKGAFDGQWSTVRRLIMDQSFPDDANKRVAALSRFLLDQPQAQP